MCFMHVCREGESSWGLMVQVIEGSRVWWLWRWCSCPGEQVWRLWEWNYSRIWLSWSWCSKTSSQRAAGRIVCGQGGRSLWWCYGLYWALTCVWCPKWMDGWEGKGVLSLTSTWSAGAAEPVKPVLMCSVTSPDDHLSVLQGIWWCWLPPQHCC